MDGKIYLIPQPDKIISMCMLKKNQKKKQPPSELLKFNMKIEIVNLMYFYRGSKGSDAHKPVLFSLFCCFSNAEMLRAS